jgi:hypothetical protein
MKILESFMSAVGPQNVTAAIHKGGISLIKHPDVGLLIGEHCLISLIYGDSEYPSLSAEIRLHRNALKNRIGPR